MHPAAIRQSARAILSAMRRKIQVILATHSLDLIDALLSCAAENELNDLSFYRLQLERGELLTHRSTGTEAALVRTQIQEDLR
jgi:AAA15 family ATPase/GTPase